VPRRRQATFERVTPVRPRGHGHRGTVKKPFTGATRDGNPVAKPQMHPHAGRADAIPSCCSRRRRQGLRSVSMCRRGTPAGPPVRTRRSRRSTRQIIWAATLQTPPFNLQTRTQTPTSALLYASCIVVSLTCAFRDAPTAFDIRRRAPACTGRPHPFAYRTSPVRHRSCALVIARCEPFPCAAKSLPQTFTPTATPPCADRRSHSSEWTTTTTTND
jgi:hypothetical protein